MFLLSFPFLHKILAVELINPTVCCSINSSSGELLKGSICWCSWSPAALTGDYCSVQWPLCHSETKNVKQKPYTVLFNSLLGRKMCNILLWGNRAVQLILREQEWPQTRWAITWQAQLKAGSLSTVTAHKLRTGWLCASQDQRQTLMDQSLFSRNTSSASTPMKY